MEDMTTPIIIRRSGTPRGLTALETLMLADVPPLTVEDLCDIDPRQARRDYADARAIAGLSHRPGQWMTTAADNVKLGKDGGRPSAGVFYAPADELAVYVANLPAANRGKLADVLGVGIESLDRYIRRLDPCHCSTPNCRMTCVISTAGKGPMRNVIAGRCARSLVRIIAPWSAARLTFDGLRDWHKLTNGAGVARFGGADDVRAELVTPGLLEDCAARGMRTYAYTKWAPDVRPSTELLPLTYSATAEGGRWNWSTIWMAASRGHNVAVVVDTPRGQPLPRTLEGIPIVDGDASDDRSSDPRGCIVALRAKGRARSLDAGGSSFVFSWSDVADFLTY